jgi:hypothetical protein
MWIVNFFVTNHILKSKNSKFERNKQKVEEKTKVFRFHWLALNSDTLSVRRALPRGATPGPGCTWKLLWKKNHETFHSILFFILNACQKVKRIHFKYWKVFLSWNQIILFLLHIEALHKSSQRLKSNSFMTSQKNVCSKIYQSLMEKTGMSFNIIPLVLSREIIRVSQKMLTFNILFSVIP